jgi:anti-sigma regulatory factor (Ser/Thr protein kinase)
MTDLRERWRSWRGKPQPAIDAERVWRLRVERERGAIGSLNDRVEQALLPVVPETTVRAVQVVFDELLTNIIMHAEQASGPIDIELRRASDALEISMSYIADEFDPTRWQSASSGMTIAASHVGGLGIALVRSLMDGFHYEYIDGRNVVALRKHC